MADFPPSMKPLDPDLTKVINQLGETLEGLHVMTPEKMVELTKNAKTLADQQQIIQTLTASLQATGVSIQNVNGALQAQQLGVQLHAISQPAMNLNP